MPRANSDPPSSATPRRNDSGGVRALEARLAEALEQLAATSEILRVISASPTDVQPVLDAVAERSARLCKAPFARVLLIDGDLLRHVAAHSDDGADARVRHDPVPVQRTSFSGRAVVDRATVHYADVVPLLDDEFPDARENARRSGFRAVLAVPLVRDDRAYGAIFLWRRVPGLFAPDQVALVETFARQVAIAIDNVRLFRETKEALEQQTATSEILRAISSSPTDIQPVLEAVVHAAARFCGAPDVVILRLDGDVLRGAAAVGEYADVLRRETGSVEAVAIPLTRGSVSGRAVLERRTIHLRDLAAESEADYPVGRELQRKFGHRTMVAAPLLREGAPLGVIALFRLEVKPFSDKQVALLQTFADQAVIAIANVRLFNELKQRNRDLTEALEQQTATSEILRVISQSQTDAQPVFETIVAAVLKLCRVAVANVFTFDGKLVHLAAFANARQDYIDTLHKFYPHAPTRETGATRAILTGEVAMIPDVLEDPDYSLKSSATGGFRSVLAVPLVREGNPIGAIAVGRPEPGPFSESQIALLRTFADQAVIAIENARLFNELGIRNRDLSEALEHQTATSEILGVISSSPTDVQPVFDVIAERAVKLCGAEVGVVSRLDGDWIQLAAIHGMVAEGVEVIRRFFPMRPAAETVTARVVRGRAVVHVPDALADPSYEGKDLARAARFRGCLGVPMLRKGQVIGAIFVARGEPGLFSDAQVALLQTFADQAVIAVENVRLFTELDARNRDLTEALDQQTATSEVLKVIGRSAFDLQPVFETLVENAVKLCEAKRGLILRFDGRVLRFAVGHNVAPELQTFFERNPIAPGRESNAGRAALERRTVHNHDVLSDPEYRYGGAQVDPYRTVLAVPMYRADELLGVIVIYRHEVRPFTDSQVALVETFADQAAIAIENVRLFTELEARTVQLTQSVGELKALGEVGQAVSSTLDLETVLRTIVSRATQLAGMDGGSIWEYDEAGEAFHLHATERWPAELVAELRATPIRKGEGALGRLALTGEPVEIRDIADEASYQSRVRDVLIRCGYRSVLAVPLLREENLLGALAVNRKVPGEFAPQVIDLLKTFATQSALAIQNARLFREIEDKGRQLETASKHKSEFLANMSHELRTPLNAIIGFSEVLAERLFGDINEKQAEYLSDILGSGRHLLSLINDILDLSKIEAGRMELEASEFDLPGAIDNTLTLVRERAQRRGITLVRDIDAGLGKIRADERKVKQVLLNLLSNALKFTPEGGRIEVRGRARDREAEVAVADTGVGIAPEDQASVFEEFRQVGTAARKVEGTGLGLAISRKFIELHGGRIWVTSQLGSGATFSFTLPR